MIEVKDIANSGILKYTVGVTYNTIIENSKYVELEILATSSKCAKQVAENVINTQFKSVGPEIIDVDIVGEDFVGLDGYLGGLN